MCYCSLPDELWFVIERTVVYWAMDCRLLLDCPASYTLSNATRCVPTALTG